MRGGMQEFRKGGVGMIKRECYTTLGVRRVLPIGVWESASESIAFYVMQTYKYPYKITIAQ